MITNINMKKYDYNYLFEIMINITILNTIIIILIKNNNNKLLQLLYYLIILSLIHIII